MIPFPSVVSTEAAVYPADLSPGDLVAVVAPSSPFEPALGWRGLGFLRERYRVRFDRAIFSRRGFLAGDDARRRDELARAFEDSAVRAVIAARGGYGAGRFAHTLPWDAFAASPKWLVGFSDITALHVEASRVGVASLHASHLTMLGGGDARSKSAWLDALERPGARRQYDGLVPVTRGCAKGILFGGNLTMLAACASAGRLRVPAGAIVFLEDVTERPYRIDRMVTSLLVGGHFGAASGFVLGDFTDCAPGADRVTVDAVLAETLGALGVPVASGLPCGHGPRNDPLVLGAVAELEVTDRASLTFEAR